MSGRTVTGMIVSAQRVTLGDTLAADASAGDTTIVVTDAVDFDSENGGWLSINGTPYQYSSVDDDTDTISLAGAGLAAGAADGDRVDVWDSGLGQAASEYRALVEVPGDVDNADLMDVPVALPLVLQLPEGEREEGEGETVVLTEQDGEWVATNLPGSPTQVNSEHIPTLDGADFNISPSGGRLLAYTQDDPVVALDDTAPGTRTWTVPAGVFVIRCEAWGAGGGGGGGAGGGGGGYASDMSFVVAPGDVLSYTVGAGGAGSTTTGTDGGDSSVDAVTAHGGQGGQAFGHPPGAGGTATEPTAFDGGSGEYGTIRSGGGGASASTSGTGSDAASGGRGAGGQANTDGGSGGNGSNGVGAAGAGLTPGGGGGGGTSTITGAAGGAGRVRISTFTASPLFASLAAVPGVDPATGQSYPAGFMLYPATITDWDAVLTPGTFIGVASAQSNSPNDARTWVAHVDGRRETGTLVQVLYRLSTLDNPEVWTRQYSTTNGWQPWHQLAGVPTWTACTAAAGYTANGCAVTMFGAEVHIRGNISKNSGSFTAGSFVTVGNLPSSAYAPSVDWRAPIASGNADVSGVLRIDAGDTALQVAAAAGSSVSRFYTVGEWFTQ